MNDLHTGSAADSLMIREGKSFAGMHIIVDLYDAEYLDNIERVEAVMRECIEKCGAHLLHMHLHHFTPNDGVTGVAVLSESHISVHTWPERHFAAFDIFMCGDSKPELAIEILKDRFNAKKIISTIKKRGEHLT
jgi:S-adenosylmethionine decarboxylase